MHTLPILMTCAALIVAGGCRKKTNVAEENPRQKEERTMTPLERITKRVTRAGHPDEEGAPRPLLTLAEFFDDNNVDGSIGCNLDPMPHPNQFRAMLEKVSAAVSAADVRVQISMFDDPEWPFSDTVWFMISVPIEDLRKQFPEGWAPDEIGEGWTNGEKYEPYEVPAGTRPVSCWWD